MKTDLFPNFRLKYTIPGMLFFLSLYWVVPKLIHYYTDYPLPMFVTLLFAAMVYAPTLFYLLWMMRGRDYWHSAFWAVPLSVLFYFGIMTSVTNGWFRSFGIPEYLFAGISEESWKIMPLIIGLLIGFLRLKSVREGIFYGALGGFGFALLEMAAYFALVEYPKTGWEGFFAQTLSRATLLGIDMHVVWSAFVGGVVAFGLLRTSGIKRYFVWGGGFALAVITHSLQDLIGKRISVSALEALVPAAEYFHIPQHTLAAFQIPLEMYAATVDLLLINIVIIPLLFWMIFAKETKQV